MKVLVCGGRDFSDKELVFRTLDNLSEEECTITEIVTGGARGADSLAIRWSGSRGVRSIVYPAQWKVHGKSAGPIRNRHMLVKEKPHLVVAFPGGAGTRNMTVLAMQHSTEVREIPAS